MDGLVLEFWVGEVTAAAFQPAGAYPFGDCAVLGSEEAVQRAGGDVVGGDRLTSQARGVVVPRA